MNVKKEITVAVIIGLILGVVILGGILRARKALMNVTTSTEPQSSSQVTASSAPTETGLFLTIETPDNQVLKDSTLTITGKTLPSTYIVVHGEAGDAIIVPDNLGSFSQNVTLVKGANTIKVTVYQEDGTKKEAVINAVYTTVEI